LNEAAIHATIDGMHPAAKAAVFLLVLFAIPIIPFLCLGESFEQSLLDALRRPASAETVGLWVVGLLAVDMFLPVPSSAVVTYAGGILGITWGAITAWTGLSLGAVAGFGMARLFGQPLARKFSEAGDADRMQTFARNYGPLALLLTRPLPILAEACVLMLGAGRMTWQRFLPPLLLSNALLAVTYAACGAYFRESDVFPVAIIVSGAIPLVVALVIRRFWKPGTATEATHSEGGQNEKQDRGQCLPPL